MPSLNQDAPAPPAAAVVGRLTARSKKYRVLKPYAGGTNVPKMAEPRKDKKVAQQPARQPLKPPPKRTPSPARSDVDFWLDNAKEENDKPRLVGRLLPRGRKSPAPLIKDRVAERYKKEKGGKREENDGAGKKEITKRESSEEIEILSPPPRRREGAPLDNADVLVIDDDEPAAAVIVEDPLTDALAQVLLLFPDVLTSHAETLLESHAAELGGSYASAVESVVALLVDDAEYPKAAEEGGGKKEEDEEKTDWLDVAARGRNGEVPDAKYKSHALDLLLGSFRYLPSQLVKSELTRHSSYFAPTFYSMTTQDRSGSYQQKKLKRPRNSPKKRVTLVPIERVEEGTVKLVTTWEEREEMMPELLTREKRWIEQKIAREIAERTRQQRAEEQAEQERARVEALDARARQRGEAVECQCCFDEVAFENSAACADGHLFCKTCASQNASTRLGQRQATLPCMAPECKALFPPVTYSSFLPAVTVDALADLAQQKDLETAFGGVEGFEKCPFCPYAYFIENRDEKLFHCRRRECSKVSCRGCKLENHIPKTCEEVAKERALSSVHTVEEAMTAALIKNCPKCKVPTCKQDGCNKMTCSDCGTFWCHRCGVQIKGYDHFADKSYGGKNPNGCPVFDDTAARERQAEANLDGYARQAAEKLANNDAPNRAQPNRGAQLNQGVFNFGFGIQFGGHNVAMMAAQQLAAQQQAQAAANWHAAMANAQNAINNAWTNFAGAFRGW
ncbi:hypothetical protein JCM10908_002208 [Rhodotorula pacifica]|uniref:uncharacterized protein n=1 Tax=Rhodotorula pacifica TaxID=1495444 RepID=UPI00317EE2EF